MRTLIKAALFLFFIKMAMGSEYFSDEGNVIKKNLPKEDLLMETDSFYDPNVDYSHFSGRVTDKDQTGSVLKINSENKNVRFFRASDLVEFKVQNNLKADYCQGFVRSIEENYFVMFVKDIKVCFSGDEYFRRGTALIFKSEKLASRVKEASAYRASLMKKKKDYLKQLNSINQNVFSFEERKVQIASDFDRKIAEIELEKTKALDRLVSTRNDEIRLQRELTYRLDSIDKELNFYRLDKQELLYDRWHMDQDLGYPVYKRPEEMRERASTSN